MYRALALFSITENLLSPLLLVTLYLKRILYCKFERQTDTYGSFESKTALYVFSDIELSLELFNLSYLVCEAAGKAVKSQDLRGFGIGSLFISSFRQSQKSQDL